MYWKHQLPSQAESRAEQAEEAVRTLQTEIDRLESKPHTYRYSMHNFNQP